MKAFMVLHWSQNWVVDPDIEYFETIEQAKNSIRAFQGHRRHHVDDCFKIARILESGDAVEIDKDIVGFKLE